MASTFAASAAGQGAVSLRGVVTDPTGAVVPGAIVAVAAESQRSGSTVTRSDGTYAFAALPPGLYTVQVTAPGLALPKATSIHLKSGVATLNLELQVAAQSETLTVSDTAANAVNTDPANNAGAVVLRGADLESLSDDPTDLEADLQALAGPAAGPNGGSIYIDGFTGGQLPSKDSIREVRINQNPFAPEYDKLGLGRVEIFTKPGSDHYRGSLFYNFADDVWNSRNPYAGRKAPFLLKEYGGNGGGPLGKRASFLIDVRRDATDNGSIINGVILDPATLVPAPFTDVYRVRQRAIRVSPRVDYQVTPNNSMTVRYAFSDMDIPGAGVGSFNLQSRGFDAKTVTHTLQVSDTTLLSTSVVNELRFQYFRSDLTDRANTGGPAIDVLGSFNGGGATVGNAADLQNSYELQDYVSAVKGTHTVRFGARLRRLRESALAPQNFNGTFTFASIELYRLTLLSQNGAGPSLFTITTGNPNLAAGQFDIGAFAGDDWRVRPNLTVSLGLRYETQTNIDDWRDFAPRLSIAWGIGKKTVVRAGSGVFYDRFALANTLAALRYGAGLEQQYVVTHPAFFPDVPSTAVLAASNTTQAVQKVSSSLRAPYIVQSIFAVERQLPWKTTVAVNYANSHGLHLLRSRDVNAPLPGTGDYPYGSSGPIFLIESAGLYNQNQLIVNVTSKLNENVSLTSAYTLNRALSNTDGVNTFPANQYDLSGEYGPAATDVRNRFSLAGSVNTKWNVRLSPLVIVQSGPPFNITTGQDQYGTTVFNARPAFATDPNQPGVVRTAYGLLDPNPHAGEAILPRNYGRGPGTVSVNLRVSKTIVIRPERNLIISVHTINLLNHNNPGPIIGTLTSPLFGQANQPAGARDFGGGGFSEAANNRRIELQIRLNF